MRTRYQNLRSSTALARPAPSSGLPGQFYVNMADRVIGFFNDAGQPIGLGYLPLIGGSLTGFLTLHANPTANLHAATKGYVDAGLAGLDTDLSNDLAAAIATRLPLVGGQMQGQIKSVGPPVASEDLGSKGYIDTQVATRLTQAQADARFLQLAGGSLTNFLTLHADPAQALHAASKGYVDQQTATRLTQAQADARFLQLSGGTLTGPLILPGPPTQALNPATKAYVDSAIAAIPAPPVLPAFATAQEARVGTETGKVMSPATVAARQGSETLAVTDVQQVTFAAVPAEAREITLTFGVGKQANSVLALSRPDDAATVLSATRQVSAAVYSAPVSSNTPEVIIDDDPAASSLHGDIRFTAPGAGQVSWVGILNVRRGATLIRVVTQFAGTSDFGRLRLRCAPGVMVSGNATLRWRV